MLFRRTRRNKQKAGSAQLIDNVNIDKIYQAINSADDLDGLDEITGIIMQKIGELETMLSFVNTKLKLLLKGMGMEEVNLSGTNQDIQLGSLLSHPAGTQQSLQQITPIGSNIDLELQNRILNSIDDQNKQIHEDEQYARGIANPVDREYAQKQQVLEDDEAFARLLQQQNAGRKRKHTRKKRRKSNARNKSRR